MPIIKKHPAKKCILCGNKIKGECYIVTKPDINSYYISTDENIIGKPICKDDVGADGFKDFDGAIISFDEHEGKEFYFKANIVANGYDQSVTENELVELCDIAKSVKIVHTRSNKQYYDCPKCVGNLEKAMKTPESINGYSDGVTDSIKIIGERWDKKLYIVITGDYHIGKIDMYVNKSDKNEFIDFVKNNIENIDSFSV